MRLIHSTPVLIVLAVAAAAALHLHEIDGAGGKTEHEITCVESTKTNETPATIESIKSNILYSNKSYAECHGTYIPPQIP